MSILLTLIALLIAIAVVVLVFRVLTFYSAQLGFPIPAEILKIIMVIFALIILYAVVQWLLSVGGIHFPGFS